MKYAAKFLLGLSGLTAALASTGASADNLLGFYAGAGVGESTVRSDYGFDPDYPTGLSSAPHGLESIGRDPPDPIRWSRSGVHRFWSSR